MTTLACKQGMGVIAWPPEELSASAQPPHSRPCAYPHPMQACRSTAACMSIVYGVPQGTASELYKGSTIQVGPKCTGCALAASRHL